MRMTEQETDLKWTDGKQCAKRMPMKPRKRP